MGAKSFLEEIQAMPGGEGIRLCIQCGTCTGSCPNANRMDHSPRETIAMARAGLREEVLSSNAMWFCASCYLCTVRCPRGIKPTDFMHILECIADRAGLSTKHTRTPVMYRTFVDNIRNNGRIHEVGFMRGFYFKTNLFRALGMRSLAWKLWRKGRMPLRAKKIKGTGQLRAIIDKARALGGAL